MADGDKAAALGWPIVAATEGRNLGYQRINQALDRIATMFVDVRDNVKPSVKGPAFSVSRSSSTASIPYNTWKTLLGSAYATPSVNSGMAGWSSGILTIDRTGVYMVAGRVSFVANSEGYFRTALQILRNTDGVSTSDGTLAADSRDGDSNPSAFNVVRLTSGDKLRLSAYQQQLGSSGDKSIDNNPYDLSFSVTWLRD